MPDVIIPAKFYVDSLTGFWEGAPPKSDISYIYWNDPYNSSALPCRHVEPEEHFDEGYVFCNRFACQLSID